MNPVESKDEAFLDKVVDFAETIAVEAGNRAMALRDAGPLKQDYKGSVELVTSADLEVSQMIETAVRSQFPDHVFFTEESENAASRRPDLRRPTWIIDPIDGTVGYARGHVQFCISIAFCMEGEIKAGVVNCPALNELFTAVKSRGALLNGEQIAASSTRRLEDSLVATGFPHGWEGIDRVVARMGEVRKKCRDIRRSGSAALDLVWVACGRLDAYYEEDVKAWDMCAGKLIAMEAGAEYGYFDENLNNELNEIRGYASLAANRDIFASMLEILDTRTCAG